MKIEILGTGAAFDFDTTSYLINDHILLDCSDTTIKELIKNKKIENIDTVFFSHIHGDHCGGFETLIYYKRFVLNDINKLTVYTDKDIINLYKDSVFSKLNGEYIEDFNLIELKNDSILINDLIINTVYNTHMAGTIISFSFLLVNTNNDNKVFIK
jgi:ribonuclease BN (tRNA processing enzyme)